MMHYMYDERKFEKYKMYAFEKWKGLVMESRFENGGVFFPHYFSRNLTIILQNEQASIAYWESIKKKHFTPSFWKRKNSVLEVWCTYRILPLKPKIHFR
jgi:hypothetical protein